MFNSKTRKNPLLNGLRFIIQLSSLIILSTSAAIAGQSATTDLLGSGIEPPLEPGVLSVQPAELDFGAVEVGQAEALTVTVANIAEPGSEALTLHALGLAGGESAEPTNELVTILPDGSQIPKDQVGVFNLPAISADGRFVVFAARPCRQCLIFFYRRDRATQTTERVSVDPDGTPVKVSSSGPIAFSADGRYLVFSGNVTGGGTWGLFRRDIDAGVTERLTLPTTDGENPDALIQSFDISDDARFFAFMSRATNLLPGGAEDQDVYVYNTDTDTLERVSDAFDGSASNALLGSRNTALSADGRFVAFQSDASNLVPDDTNDEYDTFVHDRNTGVTERVSVASDGTEGDGPSGFIGTANVPSISADGRFVAFTSDASNLVPDDTEDRDVFVHDRETGMTERVSVAVGSIDCEACGSSGRISADGRFVTFLVDNLYIYDRESGTAERVSVAHDGSDLSAVHFQHAIAGDAEGRFVVFSTFDPNVVPPPGTNGADLHFIVRDRGGAADTAFAITGGDCAVTTVLEPGDTCTVEITFSPDSTGFFEDVLNVETIDAQSQAVPLQGSGGELEDQIFHHRFEDGGAP